MNNVSSPQGVEAEHSLACLVPAQPMGQDPSWQLPQVWSAFIPALRGLLVPWGHWCCRVLWPFPATCAQGSVSFPVVLLDEGGTTGILHLFLLWDLTKDQRSRGEEAAGQSLLHLPSSACSSQDWRQSNSSSTAFGFQGQKGPL